MMKWIFSGIYNFIADVLFHIFCSWRTYKFPPVSENHYENWVLQTIEPIINNEQMTDAEKIEKLKYYVEHYDPVEY